MVSIILAGKRLSQFPRQAHSEAAGIVKQACPRLHMGSCMASWDWYASLKSRAWESDGFGLSFPGSPSQHGQTRWGILGVVVHKHYFPEFWSSKPPSFFLSFCFALTPSFCFLKFTASIHDDTQMVHLCLLQVISWYPSHRFPSCQFSCLPATQKKKREGSVLSRRTPSVLNHSVGTYKDRTPALEPLLCCSPDNRSSWDWTLIDLFPTNGQMEMLPRASRVRHSSLATWWVGNRGGCPLAIPLSIQSFKSCIEVGKVPFFKIKTTTPRNVQLGACFLQASLQPSGLTANTHLRSVERFQMPVLSAAVGGSHLVLYFRQRNVLGQQCQEVYPTFLLEC